MSAPVSIQELRHKEYWRPSECTQVLGRTTSFWTRLFDQGAIRGYRSGKQRFLNASSAREFLDRLCRGGRDSSGDRARDGAMARAVSDALMRDFRAEMCAPRVKSAPDS